MKRLILTLSLLAGIVAGTQEASAQRRFEFMLKDGLNISWLTGIENSFPGVGIYVGAGAKCNINDTWGAEIDLLLSEQGAGCFPNNDDVWFDYKYDYVNIPLLATYTLELGGHSIELQAGPQMGIFLLASYEYSAPSILDDGTISGEGFFDRDAFHPLEFGVVVGASWELDAWSIDLRYTLGITQTHDGISNTLNGSYYISVPDNRNSVLQIGTSFRF